MTNPTTPAITPEKIAEWRALLAKATSGPWKQHLVDDTTIVASDFEIGTTWPGGGLCADRDFVASTEIHEANAALIVAAVNAFPALLNIAASAIAAPATPDEVREGWRDERKEICAELCCIDEPGVALRFVKGLREDLKRAYARHDELIRSWDPATPTERQELDRLRRGWGPSTPTTHMQRWADARDFLNWIAEVEEAADIRDDDDGDPEDVETTLDRVNTAVGSARSKAAKRFGEIVARPPSAFDLSFAEGLTAMRSMLASFVENGGDTPCKILAQSMRLNWSAAWGDDPDRPAPPPAKGGSDA